MHKDTKCVAPAKVATTKPSFLSCVLHANVSSAIALTFVLFAAVSVAAAVVCVAGSPDNYSFSPILKARALTMQELQTASSPQILGVATYPTIYITSATNTSLKVTATPLSYDSTANQWTYQFNWSRTRNAQGSLYVTLKANKAKVLLAVDPASQTGTQTATLAPATAYRVEFYTQPAKAGTLLLRKFFTTIAVPSTSSGSGTICNTLWWHDSTNTTCSSQKQFCGAYMYQGLKTFSSQSACLADLSSVPGSSSPPSITITTTDSLNLIQGTYGKIDFVAQPLSSNGVYSMYSFTETGNVPGMVFEASPCNHPGLTICVDPPAFPNYVFLDGTPTVAGTYPISITVKDQLGNTATQNFTVIVVNQSSNAALSVSLNSVVVSPISVSSGGVNQRIASFQLKNNTAGTANINSITLTATRNTISNNFRNLLMKVQTVNYDIVSYIQFGTTQPVVASNGLYTFTGSMAIPAGSLAILDVYADVASGVTNSNSGVSNQNLVILNTVTGTWATNGAVIGPMVPIAGQTINIVNSGSSPVITITSSGSLNFTQGTYGKIGFYAGPGAPTSGDLMGRYTFTETGSVPGMNFGYAPCNNQDLKTACPMVIVLNEIFLYGTPTTAGTYPISITASDSSGNTATQSFTVTVTGGSNTSILKSKFLKDDTTAQAIAAGTLANYDVTSFGMAAGAPSASTSPFAYRFLMAIRQLGYGPSRSTDNANGVAHFLLNKYEKLNSFPTSDIISKDVLLKVDSQLAPVEQADTIAAADFPLYPAHMGDAPQNAPSKEHVAALLDKAFRALPSKLATWNEANFKWYAYYQLTGQVGPSGFDITNGNYKLCLEVYYPEMGDSCVPMNHTADIHDDFYALNTVMHEYAHYLDKNLYPPDSAYGSRGVIDTMGFYSISFDTTKPLTASGWTFYPLLRGDSAKASEFVSSYGTGWTSDKLDASHYTPYEDFAESFSLYVLQGKVFRQLATGNQYLQQKYNWLKQNVFNGTEYNTGDPANIALLKANPVGSYGNLVFNDIDFYWINPDEVFNYQFPVLSLSSAK